MALYPIKDYARGVSDHYMSGRGCQRLDNFVLDQAGNPLQRSGQRRFSIRIPANQKITDLHQRIRLPSKLYAHSAGNIYRQDTVFGWITVTGANSVKPGFGADLTYRGIFQSYGPFDYVYFWTASYTSLTQYLEHPKVKKILNPGAAGEYSVNLGLPKPAAPTIFVSGGPSENTTGGAGGFSYVYYAVYKFTYTTNGVTYIERSAPSDPVVRDYDFAISPARTSSVTVSDVATDTIYNDAIQNYPDVADVTVEVYRTKVNETVPYLLPFNPPDNSLAQGSTDTDDFTDADIADQTELYTIDGSAPFDEPPPCRFFHIVNDVAYYAGLFSGSGYDYEVTILQSVPGVLYSAPSDFEIRAPEPVSGGISSADIYPVVFCKGSIWRLEGQIDSFGAGAPIFRLISDQVGCQLPYTVKKFERMVYFVGTDGHHYATDGFTLKKMTEHCVGQFTTSTSGQQFIVGDVAMEPKTGRMLTSYDSNGLNGFQDTVWVGDQRHPVDGGVAYTSLSGRSHETLGKIFSPCAMVFVGTNTLYLGDRLGYVHRFDLEPTSSAVPNDEMPDTTLPVADWSSTAVVPDWISGAQTYGYPGTKITTGVTATFQFKNQQTALYAEVMSYREGQYRSETVKNEENACAAIRETALNPARQTFEAFRRLRRQGLRASLRQFRVRKGFLPIYASDPNGVNTYVSATTDAALKTAQLVGSAWPTDIKYAYLTLSATGYTREFLILSVSGDTVTISDSGNLWPTGVFGWEIRAYPLDQWVHPLGLEVDFFPLGTPDAVATAAKAGQNVVAP